MQFSINATYALKLKIGVPSGVWTDKQDERRKRNEHNYGTFTFQSPLNVHLFMIRDNQNITHISKW